MLVLEDSDEDILYLAKGVPREWVSSGKPIGVGKAPTRWGRVSFDLAAKPEAKKIVGNLELSGALLPKEAHFKLRLPEAMPLKDVTVNGRPGSLRGIHKDTVIIATEGKRSFEIIGRLG
jgi:hypothetical protein